METPTGVCCSCELAFTSDDHGVVLPFYGRAGSPPEVAFHRGCFLWHLGLLNVHVLFGGRPLCGFMPGVVPGQWPETHRWTYLARWRQEATCAECRRAAQVASTQVS
jgi:hypothetical protein